MFVDNLDKIFSWESASNDLHKETILFCFFNLEIRGVLRVFAGREQKLLHYADVCEASLETGGGVGIKTGRHKVLSREQ